MRVMTGAEAIVGDLFGAYVSNPASLPESQRAGVDRGEDASRAQIIADFVAGMTDRYAISEHNRLFPATPHLK
jgi:dGTPase